MRGPSGSKARTVQTADRPASGPDRPAAQYGAQHHENKKNINKKALTNIAINNQSNRYVIFIMYLDI
jgi:hypothetical protein